MDSLYILAHILALIFFSCTPTHCSGWMEMFSDPLKDYDLSNNASFIHNCSAGVKRIYGHIIFDDYYKVNGVQ